MALCLRHAVQADATMFPLEEDAGFAGGSSASGFLGGAGSKGRALEIFASSATMNRFLKAMFSGFEAGVRMRVEKGV